MTNQSPYRTADPLGSVVSEHPVAGVQQGIRIALMLFCLLVAIDCVYLGMWPRFGEIHWGAFITIGFIALVFFYLSWDALSQFLKARRQRIAYHQYGLRIHELTRHQDIRFDDVTSVGGMLWQAPEGMAPGGAVMWLDDVQGRRIELPTPHAKPHELGEIIRSQTFEKRRDAAAARISDGEEVQFGRIVLSALVLVIDGTVWARSTIERAKLSNRWLALKVHGRSEWLIATEQIPNLDVLLALLSP